MTLPAIRRQGVPALAPKPADYSPGRIRHESDGELAAVQALTADFPEYAKLPHDAVVDMAATFLTDEEHEERAQLRAAGVPGGWRPPFDSYNDEEGA